MNVIVDTSIWSIALRRSKVDLNTLQTKQLQTLRELISESRVRLLGVIRQELLAGIKQRDQFLRLRDQLRAFPDVPLDIEDYEYASEVTNTCRTRGIAGSPVDYLICAVSLRRKWAVFTSDNDFHHYAKCLPLKLLNSQK